MKALILRIIKLTAMCLYFLAIAMPILMFLERPPVQQQYGKREILNNGRKVAPGEQLKIHIAAVMTKDCEGQVIRIITDSTGREFPFAIEDRPRSEDYVVEVTVPLGSYPGPAQYWGRIYWACNWVQRWFPKEVKQPPLDFEIVPAEGQLPIPEQQGIYETPIKKSEYAKVQQ